MKRIASTLIALLLVFTLMFSVASAETFTEYPREETFYYFSGMGVIPSTFNPLAGDPSWPAGSPNQYLLYEALFMMDMIKGELQPLLGDSYEIDGLDVKVAINPKAHFNDGTPLTSADVKYSYDLGSKYAISWTTFWDNLDSVEIMDEHTVILHGKQDNPNTLAVLDSLQFVKVLPKAIWEKVEEEKGNDLAAIREFLNMEEPVGSGAYKVHNYNDMGIYLIRDDNYWGVERFGKLATPKYIANPFFKSNDALAIAFKNNEIDLAQAFIPAIWEMTASNPAIGTYLKDSPYHVEGGMVAIVFNTMVPGLDNSEVRRALAYAINYDMVGQLAMSGYTKEIVPMLALDNGVEDKYVDKDALKDLMWKYDPAKAEEILDGLGATKGADGIRVLPDGTRLSWVIQTGYGWTDWNAAAEVVSQGAKAVGIEVICEMPESAVYMSNRRTGDFQMCLQIPGENPRPSQPWYRYKHVMSDVGVPPVGEMSFSNEGRFSDARANEIIDAIPKTTDETELKALHTELNKIYLEEVPVVPIMYRPFQFYEFNETFWTGFPTVDNNTGVPPMLDRGAGIGLFYVIEPAK